MGDQDELLVADFLRLKREVLTACKGDVSTIQSLANGDESFRQLCLQFDIIATLLKLSEDSATDGIIEHVNQSFVDEWRDYEQRLSAPLADIFLADIGLSSGEGEKLTKNEVRDENAKLQADYLHYMIQYLEDKQANTDDEEFATDLEEGLYAWRQLTDKVGLDLRGILRRLDIAPVLLVSHELADKYGSKEAGSKKAQSLYASWADARRAFLFGAFRGSVAMCRTTLEQILKDGYGLKTKNLYKAIEQLPVDGLSRKVEKVKIGRIRVVARHLIHAEVKLNKKMTEMDRVRERKIVDDALSNLEREVAKALIVLRELIESTPDAGIHDAQN